VWAKADRSGLRLGAACITEVSPHLFVATIVGQRGYGSSSRPRIRYSAIRKGLLRVADFAKENGAGVHMPRIGSGQAGGSWPLVREIIEETLRLLRTTFTQKNIELEKQFQLAMPAVRVDKNQLQQVFVNLFMNAVHAMASGGTVTVRTYTKQYSDTTFFEGSRQADRFWVGDNVVVAEVDDSGTGISDEHLTKIFDPFFTTKPTGVGTGLGLPVSKRIVELHGGTLDLKNLPGRGVRARVMLKGQRGDYGQKTHTTGG